MSNSDTPAKVGSSEGLGLGPERDTVGMLRDNRAALAEELACVRQALPEEWRDSVPSVAVATLTAELELLREAVVCADMQIGDGHIDAARRTLDMAMDVGRTSVDCRTCKHYTTASGGCRSTAQCINGDQYKATAPRQYWIARPNV